jgi:hypothetical protein
MSWKYLVWRLGSDALGQPLDHDLAFQFTIGHQVGQEVGPLPGRAPGLLDHLTDDPLGQGAPEFGRIPGAGCIEFLGRTRHVEEFDPALEAIPLLALDLVEEGGRVGIARPGGLRVPL